MLAKEVKFGVDARDRVLRGVDILSRQSERRIDVVEFVTICRPVCTENLNPEVVVMKSAQDGK